MKFDEYFWKVNFILFDRYLGSKFYVFDQIFWKVNNIQFGQFCSKKVVQKVKLFLCYAEDCFTCKVIKNGARRVYYNL